MCWLVFWKCSYNESFSKPLRTATPGMKATHVGDSEALLTAIEETRVGDIKSIGCRYSGQDHFDFSSLPSEDVLTLSVFGGN